MNAKELRGKQPTELREELMKLRREQFNLRMHFGNAAGITDSQLLFVTAGKHPKLGFYRQEGIDADTVNMDSMIGRDFETGLANLKARTET